MASYGFLYANKASGVSKKKPSQQFLKIAVRA